MAQDNNGEINRDWHPHFKEYTEFIVHHPNYAGLYYDRSVETDSFGQVLDSRVKWVVTGKSEKGQLRQQWWDKKCEELGIPLTKGCYAIAARAIHPTKKHVCQCCGKALSILYEYPDKRLMEKINLILDEQLNRTDYTIGELIDTFFVEQADIDALSVALKFPKGITAERLKSLVYEVYVNESKGPFSPGVMSNPPDRFDGFHSDGLCCREKTDKGRHPKNMKTYTQDRRAYEEWADGNYRLANRLMGEFGKVNELFECPICHKMAKMSADHIGPISLGFCHSTNFAPMCQPCNSSKNNRLTYSDVKTLIQLEQTGKTVISWHSKYIWDKLKNEIHNDVEATHLSHIMVRAHQNVLKIFSRIYDDTGEEYLAHFLHPQYSSYDYRFINFSPMSMDKLQYIETPLDSKNTRKNKERYRRIAFESLQMFDDKDNRRTSFYLNNYLEQYIAIVR